MQNLLNLKRHWAILVIITLLFSIVGFGVSLAQKQKYESSVQLLVIQKYGDQFDAFTAKRSAETVAETLSSVIYTNSFMNQVLAAPLGIKDNFSKDLKNRKKEWKKEINIKLLQSGNFQVLVYDTCQEQAEKVAYGIAYILVTKGKEYHGGGQQVDIKMVDRPITSQKTVRPNIYLNTILGFVVGLLASVGIIMLLPERARQKAPRPIFKPLEQSIVPHNLPIASQKTINQKNLSTGLPAEVKTKAGVQRTKVDKKIISNHKGYTGEEYSQDKVNEWVKTGRFNH